MTELMFNGVFNDMTVPQCVALLSTFVCDEKSSENPRMSEELAGPLRQMQVGAFLRETYSNSFKERVVELERLLIDNKGQTIQWFLLQGFF